MVRESRDGREFLFGVTKKFGNSSDICTRWEMSLMPLNYT